MVAALIRIFYLFNELTFIFNRLKELVQYFTRLFWDVLIFILYVQVFLCRYVWAPHACLVSPVPRRQYQPLRTGDTKGWETPPHGCWELKPDPIEKQPVLLMAELSLQHPFILTSYLKAIHYAAFYYWHCWKQHTGKTSEGGCKLLEGFALS